MIRESDLTCVWIQRGADPISILHRMVKLNFYLPLDTWYRNKSIILGLSGSRGFCERSYVWAVEGGGKSCGCMLWTLHLQKIYYIYYILGQLSPHSLAERTWKWYKNKSRRDQNRRSHVLLVQACSSNWDDAHVYLWLERRTGGRAVWGTLILTLQCEGPDWCLIVSNTHARPKAFPANVFPSMIASASLPLTPSISVKT